MLKSKMKWKFPKEQNDLSNLNSNKFSPLIKELLLQRGITSDEEAEEFLSPDLNNLHSVNLLADIEKATERVHKAISANEKILVYGDYDADGVSSTAIMIKALQELGANCDYYIPNRFTEGYGPNEEAFRAAHAHGCQLIITVDTGIASTHEAAVAKQLGMDLIITDHHEPQEQLPDAFAIIHPKCSPDYTFKELAGAGVAFKFAQSLLGYFPKQYLDYLVIGTIADLVPLIDENRILAFYGLKALSVSDKPGLVAIKKVCGISGDVNEEAIGFSIGPRLNAVGRLQDADLAVQLLLTDDQDEADKIADQVQSINQKRQKIVSDIVKEAEEMVASRDGQGVIIAAKEGWNQGVLGIVASNLVRKYDRPAIVLSILPEEGIAKGSARSIPAFDLFSGCMEIRDVFTQFGGHAQAAGMTLPLDNLEQLKTELNDIIHQQLRNEDFTQEVEVTKTIAMPEINEALVEEVGQLAPFGMANPKPVFHIKEIPNDARKIGANKNHLKMQFKEQNKTMDGIGFGFGDLYDHLSPKTEVSIVGELNINEWNGFRKVQMVMQDMKIDEKQLFDHRGAKQFDLTHYVSTNGDHAAVTQTLSSNNTYFDNVHPVAYDTDIRHLKNVHNLFLYDLPQDLKTLQSLIQQLNPLNIHVCFHLNDSVFMKPFPSREDFKWLYALLAKRQQIDINKEAAMITEAKAWTHDKLIFMANVFFDLDFVKIENGVIQLSNNPAKKDLTESEVYQERLNRAEIEKTLYYSTYDELKSWLLECMNDRHTLEEELVYGL
ncbi:single-stranded-DNA-specific exonuclease RecJ [Lentibacillus amyloliquefaciens]|uniref:Single-stranded-DNA-specific exonuclease RecJ n=1 Tax=Lentibacillus amyloliquefaciens TaxID=1472767 RepID=A0A0U4FK95_9BACI|nr:single-stranded-DNA-specific exonuclease RecJ [Lentibacillus amyloliquefaciens]ALX48180.1 single-stranded-DNA-specific exonuclease RecJ [Lentibacillus amyloliquefaciens]